MRRLVLAGAVALAFVRPAQAADEYSVKLKLEQWLVIAQALGEMPFRVAEPVVKELREQITAQQATKPVEPPKVAPDNKE